MQKIKALGFNTVSFYTLWGLHNPSEGVLDFDAWKNLQPFIDAAKECGLWMIARPGPYIVSKPAGTFANARTLKYREEVYPDGSQLSIAPYGQPMQYSKTLTNHTGRLSARYSRITRSVGEVQL